MTKGPRSLQPLMRPSSVAVVGASPRGNRGTAMLRNMLRLGYEGELQVVHPTADEVEGVRAYPSLAALPTAPELLAVAVGADRVLDVLAEGARAGVRAAVIAASGFEDGAGSNMERAAELRALAADQDLLVCGPNTYGIFDAHTGFAAYAGGIVDPLERGGVGFILQSGALTHALHDSSIGRGLGVSTVVTSGNEAVVTMGDYLGWMAEDDRTEVIGLFLEQIRDAAAFADAARRAARAGKRVVCCRVGRTERGRRATLAHTGALSGSSAAYRAFMAKHGVELVDDLDELREALLLVSTVPRPPADGVVIASLSGGLSGLLTDLAEDIDLHLPALSEDTRAALAAILPAFAAPSNPLDLTGAAAEDASLLAKVGRVLDAAPEVSALALAFNVGQRSEGQRGVHHELARSFAELASSVAAPLIALSAVAGPVDPEVQALLDRRGIPHLSGARPSLVALRAWQAPAPRHEHARLPAAVPAPALPGVLSGAPALAALQAAGIPVAPYVTASTPSEAVRAAVRLGLPVAVKLGSAEALHKTEMGGVVLGLRDLAAVSEAAEMVLERGGRDSELLVQRMVSGGVELLLGVHRDPDIGPCLVVALGGVFVELLETAYLWPLPLDLAAAQRLLEAPAAAAILGGYRGGPALDAPALAEAMVRLSDLAVALGDALGSIDVNPLIALPSGQGVVAVDALFVPVESDGPVDAPTQSKGLETR